MPRLITRRSLLNIASGTLFGFSIAHAAGIRERIRTADGRDCEVTVWQPRGRRRGLIVFSHGALSAPWKYERLIGQWVVAGYAVYAPLHVDSKDHPDTVRYKGFASWAARLEDMRALATTLSERQYVAAGHSYGGLVALTLGGVAAVSPPGIAGSLRDSQVNAVVALSPPGPIPQLIEKAGYATLAVPALVQTGDRDVPPGQLADAWRGHLAAYDSAAAGGGRYALQLAGVDHYFGGLNGESDVPGPKQSAQLESTIEISTLFMDAYALGSKRARRALTRRLTTEGSVVLTHK